MFKKFLYLEWKSFSRSSSFASNLALKILMVLLAIYFAICFLAAGIGVFFVLKKLGFDPLVMVNKYLIYYFLVDLAMRLLMQKIPVLNIKSLLVLNIKKPIIVHFSLGKSALSFFNWLHLFFFMPFSIVLILKGYDSLGVVFWFLSLVILVYCNNFLNIILSNKDHLFVIFLAVIAVLAGCQYFGFFDITSVFAPVFENFYATKWLVLFPFIMLISSYYYSFRFFKGELFLDAGLSSKAAIATTQNLSWLNQFGVLGTFLKNDIKLISRNKRAKTTLVTSFFFLFYGLLLLNGGQKNVSFISIVYGIIISGGFLFTFGQFVPSWDSAYYQLMMTQNIAYKSYLSSKWWLIVIATLISSILASFYLYFGWHIYLCIIVGAIYNIGVNSHIVLLAGAYTKTPIDLASSKGAFGDKKAFNFQTLLLSIPKIVLPILLFLLGEYIRNPNLGLAFVALAGIGGFAFRNNVFLIVEKVYKKEKYKTISAYKQTA